ncbi:MAG: hypothetical protein LUD50_01245 [Clostridia bacterium]|nr:hypothetical protein [Clostridia bacterium]
MEEKFTEPYGISFPKYEARIYDTLRRGGRIRLVNTAFYDARPGHGACQYHVISRGLPEDIRKAWNCPGPDDVYFIIDETSGSFRAFGDFPALMCFLPNYRYNWITFITD